MQTSLVPASHPQDHLGLCCGSNPTHVRRTCPEPRAGTGTQARECRGCWWPSCWWLEIGRRGSIYTWTLAVIRTRSPPPSVVVKTHQHPVPGPHLSHWVPRTFAHAAQVRPDHQGADASGSSSADGTHFQFCLRRSQTQTAGEPGVVKCGQFGTWCIWEGSILGALG